MKLNELLSKLRGVQQNIITITSYKKSCAKAGSRVSFAGADPGFCVGSPMLGEESRLQFCQHFQKNTEWNTQKTLDPQRGRAYCAPTLDLNPDLASDFPGTRQNCICL